MIQNQKLKNVINWLISQGYGGNQQEIGHLLGYTKSYFSQIVNGHIDVPKTFYEKLCKIDPNINFDYFTTDYNPLVKTQEQPTPDTYPVIPVNIIGKKNLNIENYISRNLNQLERIRMQQLLTGCDLIHKAITDAMHPSIRIGDFLFLLHLQADDKLINGDCYFIDTYSTGCMLRMVTDYDDHITCDAMNGKYKQMSFPKNDVAGIYAIAGLFRPRIFLEQDTITKLERKDTQINNLLNQHSNLVSELVNYGQRIDKLLSIVPT